MLKCVVLEGNIYLIIESDNCSSQYKSAQHFFDLQEISNENDIFIIRIFGIAGHGKGEVDHVGGLTKIAIRHEIARGDYLDSAADMVDFLIEKFGNCVNPRYSISEISCRDLEIERLKAKSRKYHTIDGSATFQVIVFSPGATEISAAPRLCVVCQECSAKYGSCSLFTSYPLVVMELNKTSLRSSINTTEINIDDDTTHAIAADSTSRDIVYFLEIIENSVSTDSIIDDYQHVVSPGQKYLEGHYLEYNNEDNKNYHYTITKSKKVFFYKECVVYLFVPFEISKKKVYLSEGLCRYDILPGTNRFVITLELFQF